LTEDGDILTLGVRDVEALLAGREADVIDLVAHAYVLHGRGQSSLPHSTFLRFPGNDTDRIIGLPAFLSGEPEVAGIKWIASFPGNLERGLPRASAVLILNSMTTGRPVAMLESSVISAQRTAASAALAARVIRDGATPERVGLVGTGLINREVLRFLRVALPGIGRVVVHDLVEGRARALCDELAAADPDLECQVAPDLTALLERSDLVSFATTASDPHVADLSACPPGATVLHVSLRDLAPEAILASDNVVDDPDHVARARTSIHLTEMRVGDRAFIRCTLAELLEGTAPAKSDPDRPTVFSPFGLGVLDLALGRLVVERARDEGLGRTLTDFLPH
jgi:ornithine cyclodeaminase